MSSHELLPEIFNAVEVEQYLKPLLSEKNLESTMRVVLNLVSGRGVTHKNKPGETFRKNQPVVPTEDLEKLRDDAIEWLPSDLDKGHGWALKHPITKLVEFKKFHLLGMDRPTPVKKNATKKRAREDPMEKLAMLKKLLDDGVISQIEFDQKKVDILAQI